MGLHTWLPESRFLFAQRPALFVFSSQAACRLKRNADSRNKGTLRSGGLRGRSNVLVTSSRAATLVRSTTSVPVPVRAGFRLARTPKGSANCGRRLARPYSGLPKTHTRNGPLLPSPKCTPSPVVVNITWRRALSSPHAIVNSIGMTIEEVITRF